MKRLILLAALFFATAYSFGQIKSENLKIIWPEEYEWKIGSNQEDNSIHLLEIVPGKESIDKWSMLGTMMSIKNTKIESTNQVVEMYRESSQKESPKAKLAILEDNNKAKDIWVLFKIETPSFPNDPNPESQLYYAIQGEATLYVNFISLREKTLSTDFVIKWTKVFKNSEFVYQ